MQLHLRVAGAEGLERGRQQLDMRRKREAGNDLPASRPSKLLDLLARAATSLSTAFARRTKASPMGVRIIPRARRSNNGTPSSRSNS